MNTLSDCNVVGFDQGILDVFASESDQFIMLLTDHICQRDYLKANITEVSQINTSMWPISQFADLRKFEK